MIWIKRLLIFVLLLCCCFYILAFSLKNNTLVDIDLVFLQYQQRQLEFVLVAAFVAGGLAGLLASLPLLFRQAKKHRAALAKIALEK